MSLSLGDNSDVIITASWGDVSDGLSTAVTATGDVSVVISTPSLSLVEVCRVMTAAVLSTGVLSTSVQKKNN